MAPKLLRKKSKASSPSGLSDKEIRLLVNEGYNLHCDYKETEKELDKIKKKLKAEAAKRNVTSFQGDDCVAIFSPRENYSCNAEDFYDECEASDNISGFWSSIKVMVELAKEHAPEEYEKLKEYVNSTISITFK